MKRTIGVLVVAAVIGVSSVSAMAQSLEIGPAPAWPDPQCTKPDFVKRPMSNNDAGQVSIYNAKVKTFNREAKAYNDCIRAYIDKANLEVTRIHDQAGEDQKRLAETANANMRAVKEKSDRALAESNALIAAQNNGGAPN